MQPECWLYIRGMKNLLIFAAVTIAGTVLAGCNSAPAPAANDSAIDGIDSWQKWGQVGQRQLGRCGETEWDCIATEVDNLATAAKQLPARDDPGMTPPERILKMYQDDYQPYSTFNCGNPGVETDAQGKVNVERAIKCAVAEKTLPQSSRTVHELTDRIAAEG